MQEQVIDQLKNSTEIVHTQLGGVPEAPSQPMCATCLTSVGYPISISLSFTTAAEHPKKKENSDTQLKKPKKHIKEKGLPNIWEMNLKPL